MSSDYENSDDKTGVLSEVDNNPHQSPKKGRGRPPKNPAAHSSNHSTVSLVDTEGESERELTPALKPKRKRRSSDDEEWDEESEDLTLSQRRTRKKPALYSEESVAAEQQRRQLSMARTRGRPAKPGNHNINGRPKGSPLVPQPIKIPTEVKQMVAEFTKILHEIDQPEEAKQRVFISLRKAEFEKCFARCMPKPGDPHQDETTIEQMLSGFKPFEYSSGFMEFVKCISMNTCAAFYNVVDLLFDIGEGNDAEKVAKALRFWWNTLPFSTRRKWERQAMKMNKLHPAENAAVQEIPLKPTTERRQKEIEWSSVRERSLQLLEELDYSITCPLCENEGKEAVKMFDLRDVQEHFAYNHWQVHGYACHFCGTMYPTVEDLQREHTECTEWLQWLSTRLLSIGGMVGKIEMTHTRMLLCCADCGWHTALTRRSKEMNERGKMNFLKAIMNHHHNDGLLAMLVYYPGEPSETVETIRFTVTLRAGGSFLASCEICQDVPFRDPITANTHYQGHHKESALSCRECGARAATEYIYRQHMVTHVYDRANTFLADYLSHSARVLPPPRNTSSAPVCGWSRRAEGAMARGGVPGGIGDTQEYTDPYEDVFHLKVELLRKRMKEGIAPLIGDGYDDAPLPVETEEAKAVRAKLMGKYKDCAGVRGLDDSVWLSPEAAAAFGKWMEEWEEGGEAPPVEEPLCELSDMIIPMPTVDVELTFKELDVISGYMLNENVFYCVECNTVLKGLQAELHLLQMEGESPNKCRLQDLGTEEGRPAENDNVVSLHLHLLSPPSAALTCPLCEKRACSITGLRLHLLGDHGRYAGYQAREDENATSMLTLRYDMRTPLARLTDETMMMLPSGMLALKRSAVLGPHLIADQVWDELINTTKNNDAAVVQQMRAYLAQQEELKRAAMMPQVRQLPMDMMTPRASPGGAYQQQYSRPYHQYSAARLPTAAHTITQQPLLQQQHMQQVRKTPVTYQQQAMANQRARYGNGSGSNLMHVARALDRPVAGKGKAVQNVRQKIVSIEVLGGTTLYKCGVCGAGKQYGDLESFKAHLLRSHFFACGSCTAFFAYEAAGKEHAKWCNTERGPYHYYPDPRQLQVAARCPHCQQSHPQIEMTCHLMDQHLEALEFEHPSGRVVPKSVLVSSGPHNQRNGANSDITRVRYKYYPPATPARARTCQLCGLQFPDQHALLVHLKFHPEFAFFCWLCPRPAATSLGGVSEIARHMVHEHIKDKRAVCGQGQGFLPCPLCRINMISRPLQHILYECNHGMVCQICRDQPMFDSIAELNNHREKCHFDTLRRFECSSCFKYFTHVMDYVKHTCDENALKTKCNGCSMELDNRAKFVQHFIANHQKGDDSACKLCNKRFMAGDEWRRHRDWHGKCMGERPDKHMLICCYGELPPEIRSMITLLSNASIRLHTYRQQAIAGGGGGGSAAAPFELSDDDDDEVQVLPAEGEDAADAAGGEEDLLQQLQGYDLLEKQPEEGAADTEVVEYTMKKMTDIVCATEKAAENRQRREQERAEKKEQRKEKGRVAEIIDLDDENPTEEDDDVVIEEEIRVAGMGATIREERDQGVDEVGGKDQPGYREDEEEEERGTPKVATVREFTPNDDDELCVVAEMEHTGCSMAAQTVMKQREKKFACPKCSGKYMTERALKQHMSESHRHDAGQTTCAEELGIPVNTFMWVCRACCLAYPTEEMFHKHKSNHNLPTYGCETCSGFAYAKDLLHHHWARKRDRRIAYLCLDCNLEFEHETNMHEHNATCHGVRLFYFCKTCELGSTDGMSMYRHYLGNDGTKACIRSLPARRKEDPNAEEDASKSIGVIPAAQLHYQPLNLEKYRKIAQEDPGKFVKPSVCNHRSMLMSSDRMVSCPECRCLRNIQHFNGEVEALTGHGVNFSLVRRATDMAPPLSSVRAAIHSSTRPNTMRHPPVQKRGGGRGGGVPRPPQQQQPAAATAALAHAAHAAAMQQPQQQQPSVHMQQRLPVRVQHPPLPPPPKNNHQAMLHRMAAMEQGQRREDAIHAAAMAKRNASAAGAYYGNGGGATVRTVTLAPTYPGTISTYDSIDAARSGGNFMGSTQALTSNLGGGSGSPAAGAAAAACRGEQAAGSSSGGNPGMTARDRFIHSLRGSRGDAYVCGDCEYSAHDEQSIVAHVYAHIPITGRLFEMYVNCPLPECRIEMPNFISLRKHVQTMHRDVLKYRSEACGTRFASVEASRAHEEQHGLWGCDADECCVLCGCCYVWKRTEPIGDGAKRKIATTDHFFVHAMRKVIYCKSCIVDFTDMSQLITHYIMSHTEIEGEYRSCTECGTRLETEAEMKTHCIEKHLLTELFVPERLIARNGPEMLEYLGV